MLSFPRRTLKARDHAGATLATFVIATRLDHVDVNGNSIWLVATPHGIFRTRAISHEVDMRTFTGPAVLKIDGRGAVYGLEPGAPIGGTPTGGYSNLATCEIATLFEHIPAIYWEVARPRRVTVPMVVIAAGMALELAPSWVDPADVDWLEIVEVVARLRDPDA